MDARNDWYPVAIASFLRPGEDQHLTLMNTRLHLTRATSGEIAARDTAGRPRPVTVAHGHVWSSTGEPAHPLFEIPEGLELGRKLVDCGAVQVSASPLRVVENFLDIAHFPFVHTDILGAEPHTEVAPYEVEIRDTVDEVWATGVKYYQPQAAKSARESLVSEYTYRVPAPCAAILYKTCPPRPDMMDVIGLFVRPVDEELSVAYPWMALYDDSTPVEEMIQFQQTIFIQDRSILENQIPRKLPLDPRMESPTMADKTSIAYRRWLKRKAYLYGAETHGV